MVAWGSVPEWFGGISLLWAFWLFGSARADRKRAQVNQIGAWFGQKEWDDGPAPEVRATLTVRNASQLPVGVSRVAFAMGPFWMEEPDPSGSSNTYLGDEVNGLAEPKAPIPPGEDWTYHYATRLSSDCPAIGLDSVGFAIIEMVVTDNAGRTWQVTGTARARSIPGLWFTLRHPRLTIIAWRMRRRVIPPRTW